MTIEPRQSRRGAPAAAIAVALGLAGACGPAADPGAMAAVQVGSTGGPPAGCRMLAALEGKDTDRWSPGGPHYEKAVAELRRQAVIGGGNYLFIDNVAPPRDTDYLPAYVVKARLFACPAGTPASGLPPPPATAVEKTPRASLRPPSCPSHLPPSSASPTAAPATPASVASVFRPATLSAHPPSAAAQSHLPPRHPGRRWGQGPQTPGGRWGQGPQTPGRALSGTVGADPAAPHGYVFNWV